MNRLSLLRVLQISIKANHFHINWMQFKCKPFHRGILRASNSEYCNKRNWYYEQGKKGMKWKVNLSALLKSSSYFIWNNSKPHKTFWKHGSAVRQQVFFLWYQAINCNEKMECTCVIVTRVKLDDFSAWNTQ